MSYSTKEWWREKDPCRGVGEAISAAETADTARRSEDEHHLRLYSEREWSLFTRSEQRVALKASLKARKRRRLSLNVVKNNIDAWVNLICLNRPHINYMTKGADWGLQRKARMRTRFVEAHFIKRGVYKRNARIAKHAGIGFLGGGAYHIVKFNGQIHYEIVMPGERKVDPLEALADDPRCMYRVPTGGLDKGVAKELWPQHARKIDQLSGDRVPFAHAWHLPSGPDADDGWYAQVIPGVVTLSRKQYRWENFPLFDFTFDEAPLGWGGAGIAEELSGIQFEINSILRTIQNNLYMGGNLKVAVKRGSNVAPSAISNALGCPAVEYTEAPPTLFNGQLVQHELFQQLQNLRREASEIIGISQMNATSQTPFATMSGRAKLIHNQDYSRRFVTCQQAFEDFHAALADGTLQAAADLSDEGEDAQIIFPGRDHLETIKYSDVAGDPEDFDCEAWSASLAGETPAGRLAHIEQMMSLGMIDLAGAMYLYEVPTDLRAHMEEVLAPIELARESIDRIVEEGIPVTPTPMMDLKTCVRSAQLWYQRGMLRGVDTRRLYLLLDFHKMASMLLQRATAPAANTNVGGAGAAGQQPLPPGAPPPALPGGPELAATLPVAPAAMGM